MRANSALENYSALHNTMLFFPRMRTILCVAAYDPRGVLRHLLQIEITINNQGEWLVFVWLTDNFVNKIKPGPSSKVEPDRGC